MSYTSIMNDGFNMKRQMDNGSLIIDPELKQGKALLRRRSKMQKSVRIRSKDLMKEGFTNMKGSNFQQAVVQQNNDEIQDLIGMQNAYDSTMQQWSSQYTNLVKQIKDKPEQYINCVKECQSSKDGQLLSACLFGCNTGKFVSSSALWRGPKPVPPLFDLEAIAAGLAVAALILAVVACPPCAAAATAVCAEIASVGATFAAGMSALAESIAAFGGIGEMIAAGEAAVSELAATIGEAAAQLVVNVMSAASSFLSSAAGWASSVSLEGLADSAFVETFGSWMEAAGEALSQLGTYFSSLASDATAALSNIGTLFDALPSLDMSAFAGTFEVGGAAASAGESAAASSFALNMSAGELAGFLTAYTAAGVSGIAVYAMIMESVNRPDVTWDSLSEEQQRKFVAFLMKQPGATLDSSMGLSPSENKNLVYYHSKEGFTNPGSPPQPHLIASVSVDGNVFNNDNSVATNTMGSIGPGGWSNRANTDDTNTNLRNKLNTMMSSKPVQAPGAIFGQKGPIESATTPQEMKSVNPSGIHSLLETSTSTFSNILKGLSNDTLVKQMASANISPEDLSKGLKQLENQWSNIFKASCSKGIGMGKNKDGTSNFTGHKQYCKSWTGTSNGRSGYYGDKYILNSDGTKNDDKFEKSPINLYNVTSVGDQADKEAGRFGCDVAIPGTVNNGLGGPGYCTCIDGTTIYMDAGHPTVSCNDLCNPKNIQDKGSKNLFYHNPNNWKPSILPPNSSTTTGIKAFNQSDNTNSKPWLQCGSGGNQPPECPEGMIQDPTSGVSKQASCGTYDSDPWWEFWRDDEVNNLGRKCVVPLPEGGNIKMQGPGTSTMIDNGMGLNIPKGYKKLPTPTELTSACSDIKYANLYIEILKFRALDIILNAKTEIMGKAIDNASKGINKVKLQQSAVGRKLLRDMQKYKKTYDEFQKNSQRKNQLAGMYEDINFKSQSANISYYIWFILAISGMFLVIKKLKSSN